MISITSCQRPILFVQYLDTLGQLMEEYLMVAVEIGCMDTGMHMWDRFIMVAAAGLRQMETICHRLQPIQIGTGGLQHVLQIKEETLHILLMALSILHPVGH